MIFSKDEREHYRKELEAASKVGDTKRVKRLIDQIRLLGEIRDTTPKMKGIEEYVKHQSMMVDKEKDKPLTHNGLIDYIKNMKPPKDLPTIDLNKIGTPLEDKMWEDIFDFNTHPESFCDVLRLGFRDSGWIW